MRKLRVVYYDWWRWRVVGFDLSNPIDVRQLQRLIDESRERNCPKAQRAKDEGGER